jgi:hypothetical protein
LQVFIRTVNRYSDVHPKAAGSQTVVGGSARMSVEGTDLIDKDTQDPNRDSILGGVITEEVVLQLNKCGCTNLTVCYVILALLAFTILMGGVAVGIGRNNAAGFLWIIAMLSLITMVVFCCIRYLPLCQYPKGADE